jgi:hypothetical protein
MTRLRRLVHALAAVLAVCPALGAQPDSAGTVSLDQLMTTIRTVPHVEARYVEHRTLQALRTPLVARGTLRFQAPDRLEQAADPAANGVAERLTIDGNLLTIDRGANRAPIVIALNEHPEIGVLAGSIRGVLSGDIEALRRTFDITLSGTLSHWQLVLQPREPAQRVILQWMRVTGYGGRITGIDTQRGNGDHSEMSIVELAP